MSRLVRRRRNDRCEYTEEHVSALLSGFDFFYAFTDDVPRFVPSRDREAEGGDEEAPVALERKREAWERLGDELLEAWIEKHPFSRPWAWWRFAATEMRRCTSGEHPYDLYERMGEKFNRRYSFGRPAFSLRHDRYGYDSKFESERDYLIRLDLLTDHERQLLADEKAAP
jgi:hypothetical protein